MTDLAEILFWNAVLAGLNLALIVALQALAVGAYSLLATRSLRPLARWWHELWHGG